MSARSDYRQRVAAMITELRARAASHAPDAASRLSPGLSVVNAETDDESVIRIYDEISYWGINALDVINALDQISSANIRVELNSPGGDVFDGIAIHNALRAHPAHITTRVDGLAASIASVIAQAGDTRTMLPSAQLMIHNAWGLVVGDHEDHSDMAALLEQQDAVIAGIYADRSGADIDEIRALMDAETWLTDQATVDLGLADNIAEFAPIAPAAASASIRTTPPPATPAPVLAVGLSVTDQISVNAQRRRR
jgi:ATP-dependent protease ClpP protease subunit